MTPAPAVFQNMQKQLADMPSPDSMKVMQRNLKWLMAIANHLLCDPYDLARDHPSRSFALSLKAATFPDVGPVRGELVVTAN